MIVDPVLVNVVMATDQSILIEIYSPDAVPTSAGFDPAAALKRYATTAGITFAGQAYERLIKTMNKTARTTTETANNFQFTLDNLTRAASAFETATGFQGCIVIQRLISRSLSTTIAASIILFAGRCDKPTTGSKSELPISAKGILSSIDATIPRRRFAPVDQEGRIVSDPLFEGFRFMPQYQTATYSTRERRGGFLGLLGFKKTVTHTLQWSSYSDLDADKFVPFTFGRVQVAGTHVSYLDIGTQIQITSALSDGPIEDFLSVRTDDTRFTIAGAYQKMYGEPGGTSAAGRPQLGHPTTPTFSGNAYYSRTAIIFVTVNGSTVSAVDAAPNVISIVLGNRVTIPTAGGAWTDLEKWSDNAAALTRYVLTSPNYYNLNANWIDDADAFACYQFNNEPIFDSANSDVLFLPLTGALRGTPRVDEPTVFNDPVTVPVENDRSRYLLSTGLYTHNTQAFLAGDLTAAEAFTVSPFWSLYDPNAPASRNLPHEPIDPPDPDPDYPPGPGGGTTPGIYFYLRRRYTCNVVVTEQMKLVDFLHKVVFPTARMYLSQGPTGKLRMKNKKPADNALALGAVTGSAVAIDNAAPWVADKRGFVVIDPNVPGSETRKVLNAVFPASHNSIPLTASANITVTAFSGGTATTPGVGRVTVNAKTPPTTSQIVLDGEEINFTPGTPDTTATMAGFIYGSINAHPRLSRRFRAAWTQGNNYVDITALFGDLTLNAALLESHPAGLADPTTAATVAAASGGQLAAGDYKVTYAWRNARGQTMLAPAANITVTANQKINVSAITPPSGATVDWYMSPGPGSVRLRLHSNNNGAAFSILAAPLLTATLPPEANRTTAEVLRVEAVFSDRAEARSSAARSNVIKASFKWRLGNREKSYNRVDLKFRDSSQDYRLLELRIRDDENIAKTKQVSNYEVNGQAIDNYNQAYRIASGLLTELRDADYFKEWHSDREAALLEEGDVVAVTDDGDQTYNLPVRIESIEYEPGDGFLRVSFTGRKYSTALYDDFVAERQIPVVIENIEPVANDVFANYPQRPGRPRRTKWLKAKNKKVR